jgi:hypothetical protein
MSKYRVQSAGSKSPLAVLVTVGLCTLVSVLASCGGGEAANSGPQIPTLSGDRNTSDEWAPEVDVSKAPTKVHGELAGLLPNPKKQGKAGPLQKDSLKYGNWNPTTGEFSAEDAENATLPAVIADYISTGYTITTDPDSATGSAEQEYIQSCRLFLIEAPDEMATQPIADAFIDNLKAKGFSERDELGFADGGKEPNTILRYARVDTGETSDEVFVAYIKITGKRVLFAIENETADKLKVPGATQLSRVDNAGIGTRVGGQLLVLILHRLASN